MFSGVLFLRSCRRFSSLSVAAEPLDNREAYSKWENIA